VVERKIRLVTKGADAGSCRSADLAIRDACDDGILRNAAIIVPGPTFDELPERFAGRPALCLGLHATLNAEWTEVQWGPVLDPSEVPDLVDDEGNFLRTTQALNARNPEPDQMMAEIRAQLELARTRGVNIEFVDSHMAFTWIDDMEARLRGFAGKEGLVYAFRPVPRVPFDHNASRDIVEQVLAWMETAEPGAYELGAHPAYDGEDVRRFYTARTEPGAVANHREAERRLFTDERIVARCRAEDVEPIRFTEI
jgi:hypothetical protein